MSQPAGWYTNPDGTSSQRFWDGGQWTHDVRPVPPPPGASEGPAAAPTGAASPAAATAARPEPTPSVFADIARPAGPGPDTGSGPVAGADPASADPTAVTDTPAFDRTVSVGGIPAGQPGPAPDTTPPPAGGESGGGSASDLFGLLFDFGLERRFTHGTAQLGYRIGAVAIIVVSVLFLLGGVQGGGAAALVTILMAPLLALLWLIGFRALLQLVADRADGADTAADAGGSDGE